MESNRRQFLKATAAVTALSQSRVLGANNRIRLGAIGTGHRCRYLLQVVNKVGDADIQAVCDVYRPNADEAKEKSAPHAATYADYRRVLDRKDLDAVVIGAPDHWHVHMLHDALAAGKDVYVEKPLTHNIAEGERVMRTMNGTKQIVQVGMQQRSWPHFKEAKGLIDQGLLGQITLVETYWYQDYLPSTRPEPEIDLSQLDWKNWLGSAPEQPFDAERFRLWRWYWDFGGGAMTDLFTHWVDVAHWFMDHDTPQTALTMGNRYIRPEWDCPDTINSYLEYPGHFSITYTGTLNSGIDDGGLIFRGSQGVLQIDRTGYELRMEKKRNSPQPAAPNRSARGDHDGTIDHMRNFFECVRSRKTPHAPLSAGVSAARASHLGNHALRDHRQVRLEEVTTPDYTAGTPKAATPS
jgi:predicted dehydrogenase